MSGQSIRQVIGVRLVIVIFFVALLGGPLLQFAQKSQAIAANPTATWISTGHPAKMAFNGTVFTEQKTVPGNSTDMMTLTAPGACSSGPDMIDVGLTLQGGSTADWDYHTATHALSYTFPSNCQYGGNGVLTDLTNTFNKPTGTSSQGLAEWKSDTSMQDLGTGFTYNSTGINGNTMTLTYYDANVNKACNPNSIVVGDNTSSYITTQTATLTVNVQTTPNGQAINCAQEVSQLHIVANHATTSVTATWQGADPYGQIDITNVPDQYSALRSSGALTTNTVFVEPGCTGTCTGFKSPISGNDMLLNANKDNCKQTVSYMHVNPYQSSLTGTLTTWGPAQNSRAGNGACIQYTITVDLTSPYGGGTTSQPPGTQNPVTATDNCNVPTQNEPLRWVECPVISSLQTVTTAMNGIISSLLEVSPAEFFNSGVQNAFNSFRNIGVALLVIAGLVMVISQAADLEIFAAHTVRKALPRIIIAAILIALSWPLLQFVIIFFNDMGAWTGKIILSVADALPNANGGGEVGNALANYGDELILGVVAVGAVIFLQAGGIISLLISFLLLVLVGVVVLMIRQVVVLICVLMTPLALASYVLPGTEKIGRFWKDTFLAALVMFPLIEAFLASGAALAYIIMNVKSGNYFYHILAIIIYIAPYFAVPFAFKLAGGLVGRFAEFAQGAHHKTIESRLQGYRRRELAKNWDRAAERRLLPLRAGAVSRLQSWGSRGGFVRRRLSGLGVGVMGGYNVQAEMSAKNAAVAKELNDQVATGDDGEIRALAAIDSTRTFNAAKNQYEYKTLGGGTVNEGQVRAARYRWGRDAFAQQVALSYEMRKASSEEEAQSIARNYNEVADSWHQSKTQRASSWIGAAFENQNKHLEFKRMSGFAGGGSRAGLMLDAGGRESFVNEIYENRGSYNLAQMNSNTIEQLKTAYNDAKKDGNTNQQQRIEAIAETFMHEYGSAASASAGQPGAPTGGGAVRQVSTPGAAHTAERVYELADMTGVLRAGPSGSYAPRPGGIPHAPSSNQRRQ